MTWMQKWTGFLLAVGMICVGITSAKPNTESEEEDEELLRCAMFIICKEDKEVMMKCKEGVHEEDFGVIMQRANGVLGTNNLSDEQALDFYCAKTEEERSDYVVDFIQTFIDLFTEACQDDKSRMCKGFSGLFDCACNLLDARTADGSCLEA